MPAVWPEKLQEEWVSASQPDAKRARRSSVDSGLSLTSTISVDTTWTASDIAKAGCLLTIPPRSVSFEDEEEMRRVYSLIYDVFRYKSVLNQALVDTFFFIQYPKFQKQPNLVWLLFYDLYKRRFLPRDHHEEQARVQLFEQSGLLEADMLLWNVRVKLAASVARLRIKNNALKLSQLLPLHLRDERVVALDETPVTGWINTFKIEIEEVKDLVEKAGLSTPKNNKMNVYNYEFDTLCPKFIKCHPSQRSDLAQSSLVKRYHIILQDRAFCLGPALICNILVDLDLSGKVVQTHINSPRTMAYLANILVDNDKIDNLIAFGAGERKGEYEEYLRELGVTNTEVHAERFVDISSESEVLENVVAVLATPPNTYSGVIDPVDLVCSRGGDLSMLEVLTATEIGGGSLERVNNIMEEQRQTLRMSMSRPQIQIVLYETHSIVSAENSEMVSRLVNEMNYNAKEKHAEEQGKPLVSPSYMSSPKRDGAEFSPSGGGESSFGPSSSIISVEIVEKDSRDLDRTSSELDIMVPPCDLFELSPLPSSITETDSGVNIEKEGCYLAYLKRKFVMLMGDAIMTLSNTNFLQYFFPSLENSARHQHWILQVLSVLCILVGFVAIVLDKQDSNRSHFVSYHAILGLIAVVCSFTISFGGVFTFFAAKLKSIVRPSYNKLMHIIIGIISYTIGIVAEGTGFYTKSFEKNTNLSIQITCSVLLGFTASFVLEGACVSAWSRLRRA